MLLPCLLHVLLPRYLRFLGAGLHLSHLSHFRGPAHSSFSSWLSALPRLRSVSTDSGLSCADPNSKVIVLNVRLGDEVEVAAGCASSGSAGRRPVSRGGGEAAGDWRARPPGRDASAFPTDGKPRPQLRPLQASPGLSVGLKAAIPAVRNSRRLNQSAFSFSLRIDCHSARIPALGGKRAPNRVLVCSRIRNKKPLHAHGCRSDVVSIC